MLNIVVLKMLYEVKKIKQRIKTSRDLFNIHDQIFAIVGFVLFHSDGCMFALVFCKIL